MLKTEAQKTAVRDIIGELVARRKLIDGLNKLAKLADKHDFRLGNGGEIGSMLGTIADDLESRQD